VNRKSSKTEYYKVLWNLKDGVPVLTGEPRRVEVHNITEVLEKSIEPLEKWFPPFGKPYPSEHAARIADPKKYPKMRRQNNKFGAGIHVIFGVTDDGKTEVQAIRFDKDKFTEEAAKKWLEAHDYKPIEFEPAKKEGKEVDGLQTKYGRVLSTTNEGLIRKAKDHVDDVVKYEGLPRPHGAQLREASSHLNVVLSTLGVEDQGDNLPSKPRIMTVRDAMALMISNASREERKHIVKVLTALETSESQMDLVEALTAKRK
jgi:hypothetical protein